jgi:hypothetical protein
LESVCRGNSTVGSNPTLSAMVKSFRLSTRWRFAFLAILLGAIALRAEDLPVRAFTTADGLLQNRVKRVVIDSRGLLWVCTGSGISRFDGTQFQSFGIAQGLPFPSINDLFESRDGAFWLASNGAGMIRMWVAGDHAHGSRFETYPVGAGARREPRQSRAAR